MNSGHLILVGAAALGLCSVEALATDYYVRKAGSDSNSGLSAGSAFRTIDRAADVASAGDTVYVGAGTYSETVSPTNDGTDGNPISFVGDTTGAETGDAGEVIISRSGTSGSALSINYDNYILFRGFTVQGGSDTVSVSGSAGLTLVQCVVRNASDDLFSIGNNASVSLSSCELSDASDDAIYITDGSVEVFATTITDVGDCAVRIQNSGSSAELTRCTISDARYAYRSSNGSGVLVNCLIYDITQHAVYGQNSTTLDVYHCTFDSIGSDAINSSGTATAVNNIMANIGDDAMDREGGSFAASGSLIWNKGGSRSEGFDSSEIEADPRFEDASAGNYKLLVGSPAIDAGEDASAMTSVDRQGGTRPMLDGWDIGAYEYGASTFYAEIPYETDFESGTGPEWINGTTSEVSALTEFAGRYYRDGSTAFLPSLNVSGTPGEVHYLFFDFYAIDSWDGEHPSYGPDRLRVDIEGVRVFDHSFTFRDDFVSDNPYPVDSQGNYGFSGWVETVYRRIYIEFTPAESEFTIDFTTTQMQGLSDESFGLDNVMVLSEEDAQPYLPIFTDVSAAAGFDIDNDSGSNTGSGLLWGDIDRDGDLDAVVTGLDARLLLFDLDTGAYWAQTLGSGGNVRRQGALLDADRDGDLDFWAVNVSSYNDERLFAYTGVSMSSVGSAGFSGPSGNEGVAAGDVNADGWTDLVMFSENGNWIGINTGESPVNFDATVDSDDGITGFGVSGNGEFAAGADANNDGSPDFLYHYGGGQLFQSRGDGTYIADNRGIAIRTGSSSKSGSAWGDYDNDGDMDVFSGSFMGGEAGFLHQNLGVSDVYDGVLGEEAPLALFANVASVAGIDSTAQQRGVAWGDFDNDGDLDLLIATDDDDPLLLYENQGDGTFELVDKGAAISGDLHDAVFVDFDNDGDLDIAVTRSGDTNVLLENQTDGANYLKVRMVRVGENEAIVDVVGARVELWNADASAILARREIGVARGFGGIEPMWAHFGGVDPAQTYTVRIVWPGGDEVSQQVVPGGVSTTIGSTTIAQMLSVTQQDQARARVIRWREVSSVDDE